MSDTVPTLQSDRLLLRAFRSGDEGWLLSLAYDAEVTRHLNEGDPPTEAQVWGRMAMALGQWSLRGYGMMAVEDAHGPVGRVGIFHPYDETFPQLSYIIARRGWGQGYATEAASLVLERMRSLHQSQPLVSHILPSNTASARVASKLGATREDTVTRGDATLDLWFYPNA